MARMVFGNWAGERDRGKPSRVVHAPGDAGRTLCGRDRTARHLWVRTPRQDPRYPGSPVGQHDIDCTACRKALGLKPQVR